MACSARSGRDRPVLHVVLECGAQPREGTLSVVGRHRDLRESMLYACEFAHAPTLSAVAVALRIGSDSPGRPNSTNASASKMAALHSFGRSVRAAQWFDCTRGFVQHAEPKFARRDPVLVARRIVAHRLRRGEIHQRDLAMSARFLVQHAKSRAQPIVGRHGLHHRRKFGLGVASSTESLACVRVLQHGIREVVSVRQPDNLSIGLCSGAPSFGPHMVLSQEPPRSRIARGAPEPLRKHLTRGH